MVARTPGLLIRADASAQIGTGHVMRCVALARPWVRARQRVFLVTTKLPNGLVQKVREAKIEVIPTALAAGSCEDARATCAIADSHGIITAMVDGYHFDHHYQRAITTAGLRLLWIDDFGHAAPYSADFILNQNLGAAETLYRNREANTSLLLGPRYALLRHDFQQWRSWTRKVAAQGERVLVTLGGSDPQNVTAKVVEAINLLRQRRPDRPLTADIVVGAASPHLAELKRLIDCPDVQLHSNVSRIDELMADADVAIAAGGTTVWELARMGLPSLLLTLAENQRDNARYLSEVGVVHTLGETSNLTPEYLATALKDLLDSPTRRASMAARGQDLIDGLGVFRVWLNAAEYRLREVVSADCQRVFDWANDPITRAASFRTDPISPETHEDWFSEQLARPAPSFWIAETRSGEAFGQVRFTHEDPHPIISIVVAPEARGSGIGSWLIGAGCQQYFAVTDATAIHALVKETNIASIRAFKNAGFISSGAVKVADSDALCYRLNRGVL